MLIVSIIFFQLVIFIGLIYLFRKILSKNVVSATTHLEELNKDYNKRREELDKSIENTKKECEHILFNARNEAGAQKAKIIKEAESEKEKIIKEARLQSEKIIQQADKSRQHLISELDKRIIKEGIDRACGLIQHALPGQFKEEVHSRWIEDLIKGGFSQIQRPSVSEEINEAKVVSAFPLNNKQLKDITGKLKELLGRDVKLKEEVDDKLVAGIMLSIGSLVLDGSLRNKILQSAQDFNNEILDK